MRFCGYCVVHHFRLQVVKFQDLVALGEGSMVSHVSCINEAVQM